MIIDLSIPERYTYAVPDCVSMLVRIGILAAATEITEGSVQ
jgi:hypothetical protein